MRILAVDLGERRLGFAVCDSEQIIASPLRVETVAHSYEALTSVLKAADETGARRIVVGHPRNMDGRCGPKAHEAEAFVAALRERGLDAVLWDERLTTAEAEQALRPADLSRKERKARLDAVAAQRILAAYLAANGGKDRR